MSPLDWLLSGLVVVLGVALKVVVRHYSRLRLARREEGRGKPWLLARVPPSQLDAVLKPDPILGYTQATEVGFICVGAQSVIGVTSDYEAWILAVLAKQARIMFEFGTCTGRTAYLWARNSPAAARIYTLTLDPAHAREYQAGAGDAPRDEADALKETFVERYLYSGTDVEGKIEQLYGDSKRFDETSFRATCDLIFVDGSHAHSYVQSDSEKALRMVKPGGIILWHDYRGPHRSSGVFETLNAMSKRLSLVQLEGTSLVAYKAPAS